MGSPMSAAALDGGRYILVYPQGQGIGPGDGGNGGGDREFLIDPYGKGELLPASEVNFAWLAL